MKLRDEVFSGSRELLSCAVQEEEVRKMTGSRANFFDRPAWAKRIALHPFVRMRIL